MSLAQFGRYLAFSIRRLIDEDEVFVAFEQQMLLYQLLDIGQGSSILIEGEVVIL
jgi:hypothetical protein